MPKIQCKSKNIYYESYGEGETLLLLNGLLGSTISWAPYIDLLSSRYKLVLFDMVDQGQSDKMTDEPYYTLDYQVEIIKELIEKLNLGKVHLFGLSYGGEVAIKFAAAHEDMIQSLIIASALFENTGSARNMIERWKTIMKSYDAVAFMKEIFEFCYSDKFYAENAVYIEESAQILKALPSEAVKELFDGATRLIDSLKDYSVADDAARINTRALIIGGIEDRIVTNKHVRQIAAKMKNSSLIIIEDAAHVLISEKPHAFWGAVLGFLDVCKKEIKLP